MKKLNRLITELMFGVVLLFGTGNNACAAAFMGEEETKEYEDEPAIETPLTAAALANNVQEIQRLFDAGETNLEQTNSDGDTPLVLAAAEGLVDAVRLLIALGAQIDTQVECKLLHTQEREEAAARGEEFECHGGGDTALMVAAENGHTEVMELLLDAGADINLRDNNGFTALMMAAQGNHVDAVKLLLARGADINAQNNDNKTVAQLAILTNAADALEILLKTGAAIDKDAAALDAISYGYADVLNVLLKHGAVIDMDDQASKAAQSGNVALLKLLVERGAHINKEAELLTASLLGTSLEVVSVLLDWGADVNTQDPARDNSTALMMATEMDDVDDPYFAGNHAAIVEELLKRGAGVDKNDQSINHVDMKNDNGDTALIMAVRSNRGDIVRALVLAGAKGTVANNAGETAMSIANDEMKAIMRAAAQEKAAFEHAATAVRRNPGMLTRGGRALPEAVARLMSESTLNPFGPEAMALRNKKAARKNPMQEVKEAGEAQENEQNR